ncbi:uncharacterized protein LOC118187155 [Stegodyphus dumicola]|uniref:uncharacterized protein LOC118187155 n=1 Tax=Stegodyphus dumicola TaxID=202533 RepID=UPI0015B1A33C|nr:uncharacterized protein LOC118187155 [Stegodyphus dumicola]
MWKLHLSWDEPVVSDEIANKWKIFRNDLHLIQQLKIPRFVLIPDVNYIDICAFCDASEKGYCAAIYLRSVSRNLDIKVTLLTSKTRVAPLKVQSLPRLELCAAVLLVNLLKSVLEHLEFPIRKVLAWTDSTVVLSWISAEPYRWVPFVANRVAKIQNTIPNVRWNHINGKRNPADSGTRGMFPAEFLKCERWFIGPTWLYSQDFEPCPDSEHLADVDYEGVRREERKTCISVLSCAVKENDIFKRALLFKNIERIKRCESSRVIQLTPFLDEEGVIRVGGRLKNANIPENSKHPILLPKEGHVTNLIVTHYHVNYLHASQELLISTLRMQFWILAVRSVVRKIIHRCIPCIRNRGKTVTQIMGDLPSPRVQPSRPFAVTGVDYAGPYSIKSQVGRRTKTFKCYVSIFVCFSTKAVHLELVSDLSTSTFLAALKRFIARRGKPSKISSDCATNFKGASKELKEIYKNAARIEKSSELCDYITSEGITWLFNPPTSPHYGGLWESNVKSMKFHLKRVLGSTLLTYEEFLTVLTQVEACMNSRPLCAMSSDPNDFSALTPGHFLIGAPLLAIPESDLSDVKSSRLKRWSLVQQTVQHFWKRWCAEYLT